MSVPSIAPVAWRSTPAPARAKRTVSEVPLPPLRRVTVPGSGPEDVVVLDDGVALTGLADGRILRVDSGGATSLVADTGGRPLGIERYGDDLLVCDARRGLLLVDPRTGSVGELVTEIEGTRMIFCNNAAVGPDGSVWFTDSSRRFGIDVWRADIMEHSGTGRLLRRDPDGAVHVVLDGLQFANGVAIAPDASWVVVAQTGAYRLDRVWLTGDRPGQREDFVIDLPAFPDNVATGSDGLVWVAMASPRNRVLDRLAAHPRLRKAAWSLPERLQPQAAPTTWVTAYDGDGRLVHDLQGLDERMHMVTGVREHHGIVWLGSLQGDCMASFSLAG
ncbi:MAG: SMP-30/gluconolactonase/LRE family protein [Actinomycetota bacterium]|nr:SMP-30/gluconolactonase/LRE family protein [Actinomycetota bacterium]